MKAALFPGDSVAKVVEVERPDPGHGEVLIRLTRSSVCGTDVHYWHQSPEERGPRRNVVPGHEAVGIVEDTGTAVTRVERGDRVVVGMLHIGCGQCRSCAGGDYVYCDRKDILGKTLHGSYGEYVCVPARAVYRLADDLSDTVAVLAACNLATAFSALRKGTLRVGGRLAVFGLGGVGLSAVLVGVSSAVEVVAIDPVAERRTKAMALGASRAFDPDEFNEILKRGDQRIEIAFESSGHPTGQASALQALAPGGQVLVVGIGGQFSFPPGAITAKELTISGSAVCRPDEFYDVLEYARGKQGELSSMIGPTYTIDQVEDALQHASGRGEGKALFEW